jgi:hypothetical protein
MKNFKTTINPSKSIKAHCVYILREKDGRLYHLGHCVLTSVFNVPDAKRVPEFNHYKEYDLEVYICESKLECLKLYNDLTRRSGVTLLRKAVKHGDHYVILCEQTGQIFKSQLDASKHTGAHQSAISSMMNGKLKQTNGLTFRRIPCNDPKTLARLRMGETITLADMSHNNNNLQLPSLIPLKNM